MIALARSSYGGRATFIEDDFLAHGFEPASLWYRTIYRRAGPGAPIMDPELSWREVRAEAARLLPGVRYRRHLLWRYSLLWSKPG